MELMSNQNQNKERKRGSQPMTTAKHKLSTKSFKKVPTINIKINLISGLPLVIRKKAVKVGQSNSNTPIGLSTLISRR